MSDWGIYIGGILTGVLSTLVICVLLSINDRRVHAKDNVCVDKRIIVRDGFGKWSFDKELIINSDAMKYYGFKLVEENKR